MQRVYCLLVAGALNAIMAGISARTEEPVPAFLPAEVVQNIAVRLDVASGGEPVREPLALDLGLGFPFWLHPVGRSEGEALPFGAIPQTTTATHSITPGSSVSFTFAVAAPAGQDHLLTSAQLLADVCISDIARVGFVGGTTGNWQLKGYELTVNGRTFAANASVDLTPRDAVAAATLRLGELSASMAPHSEEYLALQALVEAQLARPEEQARWKQLQVELLPLEGERHRLQRLVDGVGPWFEEPTPSGQGVRGALVKSGRVTLLTDIHPGADTKNHIYFRVGGHKYPLPSRVAGSAGVSAPESFDLDLQAGPLCAANLRGYGLGVLGSHQPGGKTPDRFHPRALVVEIDGSRVYNSDASPVDRRSLDAIRLIPPAHVAQDGAIIVNTPLAREAFVWLAGSGAGLDLEHGGAEPLENVSEPALPEPEPGLEELAEQPPPEVDPNADSEYPTFPGENCPDTGGTDLGPGGATMGGQTKPPF